MNSFHEAMNAIESMEFIANIAVVSGTRSFILVLENSKNVTDIISESAHSLERLEEVIIRVLTLLADRGERHFLHKHDFEVATYLFIISKAGPQYLSIILEEIDWTEGLRWTIRVAQAVLSPTT